MADRIVSCPMCRHPKRKHLPSGCTMVKDREQCWCDLSLNDIAADPAVDAGELLVDERGEAEKTFDVEQAVAEGADVRAEELAELVDELDRAVHMPGPMYPPMVVDEPPPRPAPPARKRQRRAPRPRTPSVPTPLRFPVPPGERIAWWDAWLCEGCGNRYSIPHLCCGRQSIPVTVTVTRREVSGG